MGWFGSKKRNGEASVAGEPDAAAGQPRRKIGKYEILEKIATGGFGTVYKAWDPLIRRAVALQTCELPDPAMRARVFREAQLAGGLQHPNITTVYEFGVDGIVPFLAQELLSGEDLDKIIARGEVIPTAEKVRILIDVASALECADGAGIIHRDVEHHPGRPRGRLDLVHVARADRGGHGGRPDGPLLAGRRGVRARHRKEALREREALPAPRGDCQERSDSGFDGGAGRAAAARRDRRADH